MQHIATYLLPYAMRGGTRGYSQYSIGLCTTCAKAIKKWGKGWVYRIATHVLRCVKEALGMRGERISDTVHVACTHGEEEVVGGQ